MNNRITDHGNSHLSVMPGVGNVRSIWSPGSSAPVIVAIHHGLRTSCNIRKIHCRNVLFSHLSSDHIEKEGKCHEEDEPSRQRALRKLHPSCRRCKDHRSPRRSRHRSQLTHMIARLADVICSGPRSIAKEALRTKSRIAVSSFVEKTRCSCASTLARCPHGAQVRGRY